MENFKLISVAASLLILWILIKISSGQELVSPCPRIFQYERPSAENDRWYGTATLTTDSELTGVWFRIGLDKQSLQLGNWFGEVVARENNMDYLIKNRNYKFLPNTELKVRFYIKYNPNEPPPQLKYLRLNAKSICPEGEVTTPTPSFMGELLTSSELSTTPKPLPMDMSSAFGPTSFGTGSNQPEGGFTFERPPPSNSNDDDFFQGDFAILGKPQLQNNYQAAACGTVIKQPRPLITHGQVTSEAEFPWHAAIYHSRGIDLTYICGASLISRQHLITVAHCVTRRKTQNTLSPNNLVIYLGKYYLKIWSNPGIQDRNVEKIIVHPKYNSQTFSDDIAILKLSHPVEITNYVRPVCLWEGTSKLDAVVNKQGTVVGWGFDETGRVTEQLTKAYMPIVTQETCIYSFPEFYSRFTSSSTFCAGFQNGTSVCNGDSGGGMVFPKQGSNSENPIWQIRGLVSISVALQNRFRCDSSHYVVFTDVAKYLEWVNKALTL